jgi:hypothetical protein
VTISSAAPIPPGLLGTARKQATPTPHLSPLCGADSHHAAVTHTTYQLTRQAVNALRRDPNADVQTLTCLLYLHRAATELYGGDHRIAVQKHTSLKQFARGYAASRQLPGCPPLDISVTPRPKLLRGFPAIRLDLRMNNAVLVHRYGVCGPGTREAVAALQQWRRHARTPAISATYLLRTMYLLGCCGRANQASTLLHEGADKLLPSPGDPLHQPAAVTALLLTDPATLRRHRAICVYRPALDQQIRVAVLVLDALGIAKPYAVSLKPPRAITLLTDDDRDDINGYYHAEKSIAKVSERLGFGRARVRAVLAETGTLPSGRDTTHGGTP